MYKTIDLCAGIGGIRRGFEMTGFFTNVLSAEIDKYACSTYEHLFGENPYNDLTSPDFKKLVADTPYDVLAAGFPCQPFSKAGQKAGFADPTKGQIFFHLAEIIGGTRPKAFMLENVPNLASINGGKDFRNILETLEIDLGYKVIGVERWNRLWGHGLRCNLAGIKLCSVNFGVPQKRERIFFVGFDRERYGEERLRKLPKDLTHLKGPVTKKTINDVLDSEVSAKYFCSEGFLEYAAKYNAKVAAAGMSFSYRVINAENERWQVARTLTANSYEKQMVIDRSRDYSGLMVGEKKTPINGKGIRYLTPMECGKLQGFVGFGFMENGVDKFTFPEGVSDAQLYKQLGNSVTIQVIEELAKFMAKCLKELDNEQVLH
ncbi:MAG: DNA (cytosine-5-)-methyltransferase [Deltaproteobacteria bacterium]|jgi:DNA (cytosine-5)-methyltransferase 1|nr:DNA (cytosine-5-)-methyltransferase [Deltaproteobacteria bacterium]